MGWNAINRFKLPHCCACPKPDLDFKHHMSWSLFVFSKLRLDVIISFVDTVGIVDHHCLNFLFIISYQ